MAGHLAAFMSYARFDDQHDDGQLTEFRERLAAEIRVQTGEKFEIFQDRDIAWGQNWQHRIVEALDSVTLLLVIITPGFFRSPHCRAEAKQFLDRERQLGRNDLILPVYYISTPQIDDPHLLGAGSAGSRPCRVSVTRGSLRRVARVDSPWGWVVDVVAVSEAVAGLLASGAARELGQEAGGGLVAGIVARVRKVFGSDARSVDALEQARRDGGQAAVAELASALAWYARRDQAFAEELAAWVAQAGTGAVTQQVHAGQDAYVAGRDQTVVNYRPGE